MKKKEKNVFLNLKPTKKLPKPFVNYARKNK